MRAGEFASPERRPIAGMRIANDALRGGAEEAQHVVQRSLESLLSFECTHVADVLAEVSEVAFGQAESGFQVCAYGKHSARLVRQFYWQRRIAARPAQRHLAAFEGTDDGIVADNFDVAIVGKEGIGDVRQTRACFVVVPDDGCTGGVGGCHYQRLVPSEQMVQRGVRQHHADVAVAGRNLSRDRSTKQFAEQHDRAFTRKK